MRIVAAVVSLLVALLLLPGAAQRSSAAGGPPIPTIADAGTGVADRDGEHRYVAIGRGNQTVLASIALPEGIAEHTRWLSPPLSIPAVAIDGSAGGLSADGRTLALIQSFSASPGESDLTIFDTRRLKLRRTIELDGQFSFDAISPDGSSIYLIEYPRRFRYDIYRGRRLDVASGKLDPEPVFEPGGDTGLMRGLPLTRESSADGRWAYTLYDGGGGMPFVHALDTVEGRALCVFLDRLEGLPNREVNRLRLELGGEQPALAVIDRDAVTLARIDTETTDVAWPDEEGFAGEAGGVGADWIVGGLAVLAGLVLLAIGRRMRSARDGAGTSAG